MTCPPELTWAVYADGELPPDEARAVEAHLAGCPRCRALIAALRDENRVLSAALAEAPAVATADARPVRAAATRRWRGLGWGLGLAALAAVMASAGALGWVGAGGDADWIGLVVEVALFVATNAAALEQALATLAVLSMIGLALAGWVYLGRPPERAMAAIVLGLGAAAGAVPAAEALETRTGALVTVSAGETVDGTLVVAAETVRIDGMVDGDLIVAAARVDVRGTVRGDLVAAAGAVEVGGTIDGSAYVTAGALTVRGRVARGIYAAGREISIEPGARVEGDATLAGRRVALGGNLDRGVSLLVHEAELTGRVGRDVWFRGARLLVRSSSRVDGAIHASVAAGFDVRIDAGAAVRGPVTTRIPSRAATWAWEPRTWFWVATSLFGAALLGWIGLIIAPGLVMESADRVRRVGPSLGWGFVALLGTPVAIVVLAVTLVGFPVALLLLGIYLLGVYAAKIVVALALGRTLLRPRGDARRDALKALLVGLVLITLATAVPVVGWPIWMLVVWLGLGALAWRLVGMTGAVRSSSA